MTASVLWVGYPKSYTKGRARPPQVVFLHYTAGSEGPTSAEAGAQYDKVRPDETSTHYFTDSAGPALQEVPDGDRAHTTRFHGNEIGISIEICGTVQERSQWLDPVSYASLVTTAAVVAMLLTRHGLAFKRLSVDELRRAYYSDRNITGIADHNTATLAFPEDGGTHTDVGPGFPWDVFLDLVAIELHGTTEDDDMARLFLYQGGYWIAQAGHRQRIANGEDYVKAASAWPAGAYPGKDGNGFATPDLATKGWGDKQVDMVFGPIAPAAQPAPGLVDHTHDGGPTGPAIPTTPGK